MKAEGGGGEKGRLAVRYVLLLGYVSISHLPHRSSPMDLMAYLGFTWMSL